MAKKTPTTRAPRAKTKAAAAPAPADTTPDHPSDESPAAEAPPAGPSPGPAGPKGRGKAKSKMAKAKKAGPGGKKLSALDAAARVLGEADGPMACKALIEVMAAKGYWSSPGGKTPEATLYAAILREVASKGDAARFAKAAPGQFALAGGK